MPEVVNGLVEPLLVSGRVFDVEAECCAILDRYYRRGNAQRLLQRELDYRFWITSSVKCDREARWERSASKPERPPGLKQRCLDRLQKLSFSSLQANQEGSIGEVSSLADYRILAGLPVRSDDVEGGVIIHEPDAWPVGPDAHPQGSDGPDIGSSG